MTATITVPDLLDLAARRITTYGWHNGIDWVDVQFGRGPFVSPAWGQAHLYLAVGCDPWLRADPKHTPPPVVAQAEEHLAAYLVARGEKPRWDSDGFLDAFEVIDHYESDPKMTGPEVAAMWRDAAAHLRAGVAKDTRKDAAA